MQGKVVVKEGKHVQMSPAAFFLPTSALARSGFRMRGIVKSDEG